MTASPTDTVRDFYAKLSAGDAPGALGLMAPDIEWVTMWHYKIEGRGPGPVAEGLFKALDGRVDQLLARAHGVHHRR